MEEALADLRLTDEGDSREMEAWEIEEEVGEGEPFSDLCLVGCFLTATTINFQLMRTVMANLWHPLAGISITKVGEKRFVFQFYCEMDFDRMVKGAPWTFNNHLLVFHHLKGGYDPLEVDLLFTEFWIQIHNLPPGMFTEKIARQFGKFIGNFVDYDSKAIVGGLRNYMRIRAKIDIRQSLKRKKKIVVGKKELPLEWDISLRAPPRRAAAAGSSIWLRDSSRFWGGNQGAARNVVEEEGKKIFGSNLIRNDGANLGLNLYGKFKQILYEEGCKTDLMEVGSANEVEPIIVGDGKKRPRPNNNNFGSPIEEL
ncbi:hypothetical protein Gohar_005449, partial [Gossypium harknessii]|nr:hypothetical protein [Gossypium harknessii]